ncbi:MAG: LamG domain-containing protein [Kiritimatiellia bacterium]
MKRLKIVVSVLALGAASSIGAAENGLVAHFTFDDAANFMYDRIQRKAIGTVYDTGVLSVTPASPTACAAPHVRGFQVAGGWWQNNYLVVDGASFGSAQGIPYGNQAVTYSLWIKPAQGWQSSSSLGLGSNCKLLRRGQDGYEWWQINNSESLFILKGDGNLPKIAFGVGEMAATATSAIYTLPSGFDGTTWHFIAATYAERVLTLYWDGQKVAEQTLSGDVVLADNSPLILGDDCDGDYNDYCAYRYAGGLDELKVYNRALTADEVLAAYQAGAVAFDTDVVVWDGAAAGGSATDPANWTTASNRRTAEEICAAGAVLDVTPLDDGGVLMQEDADATTKVKGVICTNGQREVTLQVKAGTLAARRPSTQRGLVAHFSFDDPDSEGRLVDSGSAGVTAASGVWTYNGTESEALPIQSVEGVCGRAMYFPASGEWAYWPSTYVKTDAATTTKANGIPAGGDPVTYSLWIRPYAAGLWNNGMLGLGNDYVWVFRRGSYGNGSGSTLFLSKGSADGTSAKLSWSIADWLGAGGTCTYEPTDLFDGNWHHVVCTYAEQALALYYDGVKVATKATEYALAMADGQPISLGNSAAGGNANENRRRYLGGFDEFKIFNVALTDDEVAAEYAQRSRTLDEASAGTVPSPVTVRLDSGATAEFLGYGHEYGSLIGAGAASVGPASALRIDETFGLLGPLSGCGTVTVANWILGGDGAAFAGDFTVAENATITVADADGQMLNATFGGRVTLPKRAVIAYGRRPDAGEAVVTAAAFACPDDFSEWTDGTSRGVRVRIVGNRLKIKVPTGLSVMIR